MEKVSFNLFILLAVALVGTGIWSAVKPATKNTPLTSAGTTSVQLLAVGDINMGRLTGQKLLAGDTTYPFGNIKDTLASADITFGNLESQLADLGGETQSPTNEYRFAGPPEGADRLAEAGFDVVSTANNHMWDYGQDSLMETMDNLDRVGVKFVGSAREVGEQYRPTILSAKGKQVAFFAITTLLNGYEKSGATDYVAWADIDKIAPQIQAVRNSVDWVAVSLHGGVEYRATPIQSKVELAHQLIDAGADVVIGHHPHIPQGIERYNDGLIVYSLGNFAFWQPFGYWTEHSFMINISLAEGLEYEIIPVKAGWKPELVGGGDITTILEHITELSANFLGDNGASTSSE